MIEIKSLFGQIVTFVDEANVLVTKIRAEISHRPLHDQSQQYASRKTI
jgi:hypothetical protein